MDVYGQADPLIVGSVERVLRDRADACRDRAARARASAFAFGNGDNVMPVQGEEEFARRWDQLADAVAAGLFQLLDMVDLAVLLAREEAVREARTALPASDARLLAAIAELPGELLHAPEVPYAVLTREQLAGTACQVCGGDFLPGVRSVPAGSCEGRQLFAHTTCVGRAALVEPGQETPR